MLSASLYFLAIVLVPILVFAALERIPALQRQRSPFLRPYMGTDLLYLGSNVATDLLFSPKVLVFLFSLEFMFGWEKPFRLHWSLQLILSLLLFDLALTLAHVLHHRVPLFWKFHKAHHSILVLDAFSSFRRSPLEAVSQAALMMVRFLILCFVVSDPKVGVVTLVIFTCWGAFIHSNLKLPLSKENLGLVTKVFVTPEVHHLHHTQQAGKNFATMFTFWDRLMGSYAAPTAERREYGIPGERAYPQTFFAQLAEPFRER